MPAKKNPRTKRSTGTTLAPTGTPAAVPALYTPQADLQRMLQAMNQRFSEVFGIEPFVGLPSLDFQFPSLAAGVRPVFSDVVDRGDHYEIRSDLPGVSKENINVSLHGTRVEITAETKSETSTGTEGAAYRERSQGTYYRAFDLDEDLNSDKVEATFVDGVLTLTLPKKHPVSPESRRIPVR